MAACGDPDDGLRGAGAWRCCAPRAGAGWRGEGDAGRGSGAGERCAARRDERLAGVRG